MQVPDTYFVEREDSAQPLTPEGGLTASLSHMDMYDPDPPLDFDAAAGSPGGQQADAGAAAEGRFWQEADPAAQQQDDDPEEQPEDDWNQESDAVPEPEGSWGQAEVLHADDHQAAQGQDAHQADKEQNDGQAEPGDPDEDQALDSAGHAGAEEQSQAQSDAGLTEEHGSVEETEPYSDAAFDGPEVPEALPAEQQQQDSVQGLYGPDAHGQLEDEEGAAAADAESAEPCDDVRQHSDDVISSTSGKDAVAEPDASLAPEVSQGSLSLNEQSEAVFEGEGTASEYAAQPEAEQLAAEAVSQDNELIGYVFDKAAQDGLGLLAESQPGVTAVSGCQYCT